MTPANHISSISLWDLPKESMCLNRFTIVAATFNVPTDANCMLSVLGGQCQWGAFHKGNRFFFFCFLNHGMEEIFAVL